MALNGIVTYPPPPGAGPWQPAEPPPSGDPVYAPQPYPYPPPGAYGAYPPYGQPPYGQPPFGYGYPPQPPAPTRVTPQRLGWALAGSGLLIAIAAFMTWASAFGIGIKGTDGNGDGAATFAFGAVVLAMGIVIVCKQGRLWTSIVACVLSGLTVITAFYDILDVRNVAGDVGFDSSGVSVGAGLWLTLAGGLVALGCSIAGMARRIPRT